MNLIKELVKVGLSDKEARVYVASMELGQATVQEIAFKSGVNRATTYVILESLMQKGIVSTFNKGKKSYFVAEGPHTLKAFIREQADSLKKKSDKLDELLPELNSVYNLLPNKPTVRFYEGKEGIKSMHQEFINTAPEEAWSVFDLDLVREVFPKTENDEQGDKRRNVGTKASIIYNTETNEDMNKALTQALAVDKGEYPFEGEITIFDDKVFFIGLKGYLSGVVIESKVIANSMRSLFKLAFKKK